LRKGNEIRSINNHRTTKLAMVVGEGFPGAQNSVFARVGGSGVFAFADSDGIIRCPMAAFDLVTALEMVEILPSIQGDSLDFRNPSATHVPCGVSQFKDEPYRSAGQDAGLAKIGGGIQAIIRPDTVTTAAARATGRVEIAAFAMVAVIVVHQVPIVNDEPRHTLDPNIDSAAG